MSPSSMKSSTPETVTICSIFQLAGVKVTAPGETVPSPVLLEESVMVTLAVGWLSSTTVNWAVSPASLVTRSEIGATVIPAVSSSVFVTKTSSGSITSYFPSLENTGPTTIV